MQLEQKLVSKESGYCVWIDWHVYVCCFNKLLHY